MIGQGRELDGVWRGSRQFEGVEKLAPQSHMQTTVYEIIGIGDADLIAGLAEIRLGERGHDRSRPVLEFRLEQLWGPASPRQRPATNTEQ